MGRGFPSGKQSQLSRPARLPRTLCQCGPLCSCLSLPPSHPGLAALSSAPQHLFLLMRATWAPRCGVSRQKRKPRPPSGCQGGWQEGASPPGVSWEALSSPEKGHSEIKLLRALCASCVSGGRGDKKPRQPPSPVSSSPLRFQPPLALRDWKVARKLPSDSGCRWRGGAQAKSQRPRFLACLPRELRLLV